VGENSAITSRNYLSLSLPRIESAEMMFSASRSRRVSIVAIIQSFAQMEKNYGKEGTSIIIDNTQLTIFGGFAPNSESANTLSKSLGTRTVLSGSVNRGKNDPSQSLQMIERPLLTSDELKTLPKGNFIVTKTGANPMKSFFKIFFKWGIVFGKVYELEEKGLRKVEYADKVEIEAEIIRCYGNVNQTISIPIKKDASGGGMINSEINKIQSMRKKGVAPVKS
jgi:type IV secretion system protein VirD4